MIGKIEFLFICSFREIYCNASYFISSPISAIKHVVNHFKKRI